MASICSEILKNDFSCHEALLGGGGDCRGFGSRKRDVVGAFFFDDSGTSVATLDATDGDDSP